MRACRRSLCGRIFSRWATTGSGTASLWSCWSRFGRPWWFAALPVTGGMKAPTPRRSPWYPPPVPHCIFPTAPTPPGSAVGRSLIRPWNLRWMKTGACRRAISQRFKSGPGSQAGPGFFYRKNQTFAEKCKKNVKNNQKRAKTFHFITKKIACDKKYIDIFLHKW